MFKVDMKNPKPMTPAQYLQENAMALQELINGTNELINSNKLDISTFPPKMESNADFTAATAFSNIVMDYNSKQIENTLRLLSGLPNFFEADAIAAMVKTASTPHTQSQETVDNSEDSTQVEAVVENKGEPDDLTQIKGIGPKLSEKLNDLGIHYFSQIAQWSQSDIQWVDESLSFKGRVEREEWIPQAKLLAK